MFLFDSSLEVMKLGRGVERSYTPSIKIQKGRITTGLRFDDEC